MHYPDSIPESETHKILRDFLIQTDQLISARQPDLVLANKKKQNLSNTELCWVSRPEIKNKKKAKKW